MNNLNPQEISVLPENLPLYCSGPDNEQWNGHPRVFLPLREGESGSVSCPYCGTRYRLTARCRIIITPECKRRKNAV